MLPGEMRHREVRRGPHRAEVPCVMGLVAHFLVMRQVGAICGVMDKSHSSLLNRATTPADGRCVASGLACRRNPVHRYVRARLGAELRPDPVGMSALELKPGQVSHKIQL